MKKKVGIIASSVATIAVCASMVVGSTYALFTSEDKVDIAITSGNVEVTAEVQHLTMDYDKAHVTGSNVQASLAGNTVTLDKMLPGDIVTFDIVIENTSNVDVQYRTSVICEEGFELMSGLDFTIGGEDYSGLVKYVTAWSNWEGEATQTVSVTIALPWNAGNEYKNLSCKIAYAIEAVQGNADKSGEQGELIKTKVSTAEELNSALAYVSENGGKIMLTDDITLNETAPSARSVSNCVYNFTADEVYIDLNGKKLTANTFDLGHIFCVNGSEENTAKLTVCNGEIYTVSPYDFNDTCNLITVGKNAEVLLDNVIIGGIATKDNYAGHNGYGVSTSDTSKVTIKNNTVIAARNPVGTNASIAHNPEIVIDNSTLNGYFTGLLFNVDGTLSVSNSTLTGVNFGAVIRSGDVTFTNCTLGNNNMNTKNFPASSVNAFNSYYNAQWNQGGTNNIPLNTLVVGNKNPGGGYGKYANVMLINTELIDGFIGKDMDKNDSAHTFEHHKIYGYGITDSYATITYDKATAELSNLVEGDVRLDNNATAKKIDLTIATAAELQAFAEDVNGGNNYAGKLVVLANDIDLSGIEWTPIGFNGKSFNGTFDGLNHTISNLTAVYENANNVALFGSVQGGSRNAIIKNVSLEKVTVQGVDCVGAVVGQGVCLIENVSVTEANVTGGHYVGGVVGYGYAYVNNCSVNNSTVICNPYKVDGAWDNGDKAGGVVGYLCAADATNCSVKNTTVKAWRDLGGVVGCIINSDGHECRVLGNVAENVTVGYVENPEYTRNHENSGTIYGRYGNGEGHNRTLEESIAAGDIQSQD